MAATEHRFSRYADVVAALADPALAPVPPGVAAQMSLSAGAGADPDARADVGGVGVSAGARSDLGAVPTPAPGTAAWLRATVARFSAGPVHRRRRAVVEADLDRLDPDALRRAAARAAASAARTGGAPAEPRLLAVRVLADALGLPDPDAVAADVRLVAGVYFGGDDEAADAAVARLMAVLLSAGEPLLPDIAGYAYGTRDDAALDDGGPPRRSGRAGHVNPAGHTGQSRLSGHGARAGHADPAGHAGRPGPGARVGRAESAGQPEFSGHVGVAAARLEAAANRIGLLVQACDATGALADKALRAMGEGGSGHPVEAVLAETLRHDPPVRTMRRVALRAAQVGGVRIAAGDSVTLDIAAANRDPEVFAHPDVFAPERTADSLTFGAEPRRCPGRRHALALAAGILDDARAPKPAPSNRLAEAA
jgi:cytochrome P450